MLLARVLRWAARITSLLILGFIALSLTEPSGAPTASQGVALVFFPGLLAVGFVLAWWREGLGAVVATVGIVGFYAWSLVSGGHFARGPWFLVCWSPTPFFAAAWYLQRRAGPHATASSTSDGLRSQK